MFLWGALESTALAAADCAPSQALWEVNVQTNGPYLLASSLTLGAWVPLQVSWTCAKQADDAGHVSSGPARAAP